MKAYQLRSPLHLFYSQANLDSASIEIWVSDDATTIDETATADYLLSAQAVSNVIFTEIADLIRSKNLYNEDATFYSTTRDTAKEVLIKATLLDSTSTALETVYNQIRVRDGYLQRSDEPQILKNLISTDIVNDWTLTDSAFIANVNNPYGESNASLLSVLSNSTNFNYDLTSLNLNGIYTFSVIAQVTNIDTNIRLDIEDVETQELTFELDTGGLTTGFVQNDGDRPALGYDTYPLSNDYYMFSVTFDTVNNPTDLFIRIENNPTQIVLFNPTLIKGEQVGLPENLLLQDNTTVYSDSTNTLKVALDKKYYQYTTNQYEINNVLETFTTTDQSKIEDVNQNITVEFPSATDVVTLTYNEISECLYSPSKVSFVNRFGVIQDITFFKKKVETTNTTSEQYEGYTILGGEYLPYLGQKQNYIKRSRKSFILASGFYPESFNTVFQQLQQSLNVWVDDEPVIVTSNSVQYKTQVNDKLIEYTINFEYANQEVNRIL